MRKEAYYFSHDGNAQDDPKCIILIQELGMEGYGIFWALVEKLRSEADFRLPLSVVNAFAMRWHTSASVALKVIKDYDLFVVEGDYFYSRRLTDSMNLKSEKAKKSASYRWGNANGMQPHANGMRSNAIKGKEKKKSNSRNSPFGEGFKTVGEDHNGNPIRVKVADPNTDSW